MNWLGRGDFSLLLLLNSLTASFKEKETVDAGAQVIFELFNSCMAYHASEL